MDSTADQAVYEAFQACLNAPPEKRPALLGNLDPTLRGQLEKLLAAHEEVRRQRFLDAPLLEPEAADGLLGQRVDDYQILSPLGAGGMGQVYRARQLSTGRDVAVKFVGRSAWNDDVDQQLVQRFRKEIEATACLKHDHIVTAFGAGEFRGRLYYAMELVAGKSLQELLLDPDSDGGPLRPLAPQTAARYLAAVADAVQHAHDCGFLHRDLKPQNILVEETTDRPYVTDFGLATATGGQSQSTLGGPVGTPSFMAPEQALARPCSVATDVYGLGATLYSLLVARPPFQAGSSLETQRQVIHAEPVTPRRLNPGVPRDLEAIVLKCLEKNPRQRYATAAEFREDLQRFLAGRPTVARPIGPWKRLGRWCRREPRVAALSAAILLILTAAAIAAGLVAEKRRLLLAQREVLLQDLDRSLTAQKRSTQQAAANFDRANQAVADLQAVAARSDIDLQLRQQLLTQIDGYLQAFLQENSGDPQLKNQRAAALLRRAQIAQEIRSPQEAIEHYLAAAGLLQELLRQAPQDRQLLRDLAGVHQGLASAYSLAGQSEPALQAALRSREWFQSLRQLDPGQLQFQEDHARLLINLGVLHADRGDFPSATQAYQAAEEILQTLNSPAPPGRARGEEQDDLKRAREVRADLAKLHLNLASLFHKTGDPDRARDENAKALTLLTGLVQEDPADSETAHDLALLLTNTGLAAERAARHDEALQHFRRAAGLAESLRQEHPQVLAYQDTAADIQRRLGQRLQAIGQLDEAAECLARSAAVGQEILKTRSGGNAAFLQQLIRTYRSLGRVHQQADRPEPMQAAWEAGIALCRRVLDHHPDAIEFAIDLGMFYRDLGSAAERRSDLPQAADWTRQAVELLEPLVRQQPQEGPAARLLLENLLQYAGYLQALGRAAEAIPRWEQAIRVYPLAPRAPSDGKTTADLLFLARAGLADSLHALGDADQLVRQAERLAEENSDTHSHFTAARFFALAAQLAAAADPAGTAPPTPRTTACYEAAVKNLQQAAAAGYFAVPENRQALSREPAFQPLQSHPQFQKLLQR